MDRDGKPESSIPRDNPTETAGIGPCAAGREENGGLFLECLLKAYRLCPDPVAVIDLAREAIIDANQALCDFLGYTREEILGHAAGTFQPWRNESDRAGILARLKNDGGMKNHEVELVAKDGGLVHALISANQAEMDGRIYVLAVLRDLGEIKATEAALQRELAVNRALARLSHALLAGDSLEEVAFLTLDLAREITGSRHGYVGHVDRPTGRLAAQAMTPDIWKECRMDARSAVFIDYHGLAGWVMENRKALMTNDPARELAKGGVPEGHLPIHNFLSVPVMLGDKLLGQVALANSGRDYQEKDLRAVTQLAEFFALAVQRHWSDADRDRLEAQARQSHRMEAMGSLAGGIAHDFNNILGSMVGYTEMAMDDLDEGRTLQARASLTEMMKGARRARDLVRQILAFSRQNGEEAAPLVVAPVVREVMALMRAGLPSTVEIRTEIGAEGVMALGDSTRLHQVVMNLCTNAAQAMESTGGVLTVTLRETALDEAEAATLPPLAAGPHLKLSVRDTGPGMSREVLERIFDPFFTTKKKGEGTGMGLAMVHGIISRLKGAVAVESREGEGALFEVYLPVLQGDPPQLETEETIPGGDETILFVDDEPGLVYVAASILKRLGYHVEGHTDSREALEAFQARPGSYDLLVTDQTMPGLTGTQLAGEVLKLRPGMPIVLCTGYGHNITREAIKRAGILDLVYKPLVKGQLARTIRRALDGGKDS